MGTTVIIIIGCVGVWIVFSAIFVAIICINSARLSRIEEPFKDPTIIAQERKNRNDS